MSGRAAEAAAVSVLALAIIVVVAAPVLRAPSERLFGREIVGRHHDPFTVMEQFSQPTRLGAYSQPFTDIPAALLAQAAGPVAAYNWLVLLTFPLSAAAAYLLARHLDLSRAGSTIAALAFTFSPFHFAHSAYHPHIAQVQWMPLYFLALWRSLDESSPRAIGLLVLSIAGVMLSNLYGGLIAAVITPAAVASYWAFKARRQPGSISRLTTTLACLGVAAIGGIVYAWYAEGVMIPGSEPLAFASDDLFRYSAKWWSYLVPPVEHPLLGRTSEGIWRAAGVNVGLLEQQVSIGWSVIALSLVALLGWFNRRDDTRSRFAVPILATVAAVAWLCSLSPVSALLHGVAPMFRAYARFGVVVQLMAALLAAIGAEHLWRARAGLARYACVALLALAAAEYAVWPSMLWRDVLPTTAHRWAAKQSRDFRALDCAPFTPESQSIEWLSGDRISARPASLEDCTEPDLADRLVASGYNHLLVRRDTPEGRWFSSQPPLPGLAVAASFDDGVVFVVTAKQPLVYTVRMMTFYPREYDRSWTWRWMGPDASWTIVNRSDRYLVANVNVEMMAFNGARRLTVALDGGDVQTLLVEPERGINRIGPLTLPPGSHALEFRAADPATVAGTIMNNGDPRPLSFGFGTWQWVVLGQQP